MRGREVREWELELKRVFDRIDAELEEEYGDDYRRRASRPPAGKTSNPEVDGLFNVGATFSAGFGSEHGRGYIVKIDIATLERVPTRVREQIRHRVADRLRDLLAADFPDRQLEVVEEGKMLKITGDLRLG
jgi:hypothetical protein